jgi:FkbM family methyltransferase
MFDAVYTFEPDAKNFGALAVNTLGTENVFASRAVLGEKAETVDLFREETNCGAYNVEGTGQIPTIRVDDLRLPDVDLIYLDVEGYELRALRGAEQTLKNCTPVVCVEEKHLGNRFFGEPKGAVTEYLTGLGYRLEEKVHNDLVFVA